MARLAAAGCVAAEEEAAELQAAASDAATLAAWLGRRERGEPLAWITGVVRFCGHPVRVEPGVYVPRRQSEELAHRAAAVLPPGGWAADLCTGAGAVAVHLKAVHPTAAVVGVDRDLAAVRCATRNGVAAIAGDLGDALRQRRFDLVTAVAPYVPTAELHLLPSDALRHEPRSALDGGTDGLEVVRRVVATGRQLLRPGGWLLVEVGGEQDGILAPALAVSGFGPPAPWCDEEGDLRGLAARLLAGVSG